MKNLGLLTLALQFFWKKFLAVILILGLECLFRVVLIFVWNWVVSSELNQFLFGSGKLSIFKGLVLSIVVQGLFYAKGLYFGKTNGNSVVNNNNNGGINGSSNR